MKKFLIFILGVMFLFSFSFGADKTKTQKSKQVSSSKKAIKVAKKALPEPKNAPFKEKIGIGIDILNKTASLRFWLSNKLALDCIAGLNFAGGTPSAFGLNLGTNIVFPLVDDQKLRLDLAPGMLIKYSKNTIEELASLGSFTSFAGGDISTLKFIFNIGTSFEVFLGPICNDLSIGSSIGVGFGFKSVSVGGSSSTNFVFSLVEDFAVMPIIIRYYL